MTKDEVATYLADRAHVTKTQAGDLLNSLLDLIAAELRGGRDFMLRDVGTLSVKQMAARMGRNPRTGETVPIAARRAVKFKISTALSNQLNA